MSQVRIRLPFNLKFVPWQEAQSQQLGALAIRNNVLFAPGNMFKGLLGPLGYSSSHHRRTLELVLQKRKGREPQPENLVFDLARSSMV
jgi:hypothetical protein